MLHWLIASIELLVGLVCLFAAWGAWNRLHARVIAALFMAAGVAAVGHAAWMLIAS